MTGDLHCHTRLSDGSLGIEDIIAQAKRTGIDFISITDHDTMASTSRAMVLGERYGVHIIPGVEFSAFDKKRNRKVHILCYMPEKPDRLEGLCMKISDLRKQRMKKMIEKVMEIYPITMESVLKYAAGSTSIFTQHIMHALIDLGYTTEYFGDLFHVLFNSKTGTCYVPIQYPDVNFVINMIHSADGLAVMAHPTIYDSFDLMYELAESGKLDGIEAWHHSNTVEDTSRILSLCLEHNLIPTGGSDFHGMYSSHSCPIGSYITPKESIERILKKNK